ncbi:DUF4364 family protein [Ruminococcaceae bacterium OttesenSCG-928-I18]|nr:DUF4364 family protein [Ruminococcaceae bacterium OttesenSCG-928-I18]
MASNAFTEGVRPGGLTTGKEIRILLCYLLDNVPQPIRRQDLEEVLVGEELANYFVMAESLAQLEQQGLLLEEEAGYLLTEEGRTVAKTLADEVPRTVREMAVRGVVRAQQYAARKAAHESEVVETSSGRYVRCNIGDETGRLFHLELYMPDELSAKAVRERFIENGDTVYELVLAALTDNRDLVQKALEKLED